MQRIMIIGQPGAGKSRFAGSLGGITHLPVFHIDHIHWMSGWQERDGDEKDRLCHDVHAKSHWIFEGGRSKTWPERLQRADTLIWLDVPLATRLFRVIKRTLLYYGRSRPDLPAGCPDRFNREFLCFIWSTRHSSRMAMQALFHRASDKKADCTSYHFSTLRQANLFLANLRTAVARGNLGIPHR